ncbi:MAG TPA: hypothetical protein VNR88_05755, partial [Hyphomicrobium sp.]|nr:hypothetical protein [Hyphomicrobium sp.]
GKCRCGFPLQRGERAIASTAHAQWQAQRCQIVRNSGRDFIFAGDLDGVGAEALQIRFETRSNFNLLLGRRAGAGRVERRLRQPLGDGSMARAVFANS